MPGHRGYVVAPDLVDYLLADLRAASIECRIVEAAQGLGEWPRPVLVSSDPAPQGWTRYRRCQVCRGPVHLGLSGKTLASKKCAKCSTEVPQIETIWTAIEEGFTFSALGLPAWIDHVGLRTVADVRRGLASGDLINVGPERIPLVAEALDKWRRSILKVILNDIGNPQWE